MKSSELLAINSQNWHDLGPGMDPEVAKDLGYTPFDELDEVLAEIPAHVAAFQSIGSIPTKFLIEEVPDVAERDDSYKEYGHVPKFSDIPRGSGELRRVSQQNRTAIHAAAARDSLGYRKNG
jgi:hypothetical protein